MAGSTQHLNLVSLAYKNEFSSASIPLDIAIETNAFANKPIAQRRDGISVPFDGDLTLRVQ